MNKIDELYAALQAVVSHISVTHTFTNEGHVFQAEAKEHQVIATATADTHEGALAQLWEAVKEKLGLVPAASAPAEAPTGTPASEAVEASTVPADAAVAPVVVPVTEQETSEAAAQ